MWAPCQALEKSAELPARELCCQSCQTERSSQAGPEPGPQPSHPSPASLRIRDPPWHLEEEAGKKDVGILRSADSVTLGWLLPTLDPVSPRIMKRVDRAIQVALVCHLFRRIP